MKTLAQKFAALPRHVQTELLHNTADNMLENEQWHTIVALMIVELGEDDVQKLICEHHPFNQTAHEHLLSVGYTHEFYPDSWEDVGNPENGPELDGGPAYDQYTGPDEYVYITFEGRVADHQQRDLELEKWTQLFEEHLEPAWPDCPNDHDCICGTACRGQS